MQRSLATLAAMALAGASSFGQGIVAQSGVITNGYGEINFRPARSQRRYDPKTGRSISAAEYRRHNAGALYNEHGQRYGQSGNKLARKAAEGRVGMATLR